MSEPNEKLDLSTLDPVPDDRTLDALTSLIAGRIVQARKQKLSLWFTLRAYSRWAAGLATATAAAVLFLSLSTPPVATTDPDLQPDVAMLSWDESDAAPTVTEILQVLGDEP